ncbi:MAG: membrane protein [Lysobacteraceae bacterium]|nr:MAG: membrane protein [Xanthomonadaceae bacterium]
MRSANPALRPQVFLDAGSGQLAPPGAQAMRIEGTVNKTAVLLVLVLLGAGFCWSRMDGPDGVSPLLGWGLGAALVGLVLAVLTVFRPQMAPVTAPLYALVEGVFVGAFSALFEASYPGIVIQATALTFATLGALLAAYRAGWVRATAKFRMGVVAATGGIFLLYLANLVAGLFGYAFGILHDNGWMGIGLSLVIVTVAALNLVLDFDLIERSAEAGAPRYMEWYGAFALVVTLVWLYVELLHLLAKLQSRD